MNNMNNNNPDSFSVIDYFRGKTVFLTGATGLLGRQVVEKLLHCTEVDKIYILMRAKRNKSIVEREKEYVQNQLFKFRLCDAALSKISVIAGDISQDGLGISITDRKKLLSEVHVIVHSAATVRFDEPLSVAMNLNVRATQRMMDLAADARQLESFVYVSTAFTHCYTGTLDEEISVPTVDPHMVLRLMSQQDTTTFDTVTAPQLIGPHPNTYTLTKSLSDHLVVERAKMLKLPVAITKPAIITGPLSEPFPGYCDELTQAIPAVGVGIGMGITRVIPGASDNHLPIIPVDTVANSVIMIAAKTACEPLADPRAYGIFNTSANILTQGAAFTAGYECSIKYPLLKALRPPAPLIMTKSKTIFNVLIFLFEIVFAMMADLMLRAEGKKAVVGKIVAKAHKNILLLSFFLLCDWQVRGSNNRKLFDSLTEKEKVVFAIDPLDQVDWKAYFEKYYLGVRRFYFGEFGPENDAKADARRHQISITYNSILVLLSAAFIAAAYGLTYLLV